MKTKSLILSTALLLLLSVVCYAQQPTAPSGLGAFAVSSSAINLAWNDNSTNETGFQIERSLSAGGTFTLINTAGANSNSFPDTGLEGGTQYFYRVLAVNGVSNSAYTAVATATTTGGSIAAPGGLGAFTVSSSAINIVWTDNSNNETEFQIERSLTAGSGYSLLNTTMANMNSYADVSLASGTTYFYRVRAANGSSTSVYTAVTNATTSGSVIPAPGSLTTVAASASAINLTWTDNTTNETGFQIERSLSASTGFALVATTTANVTSFADTGLATGTRYFYRVRAVNAAGNSLHTAEANTTTLNAPPAPPTTLTATATSSTQINLTWTDTSPNETGFEIERSVTSGGPFTSVTTTVANATTYPNTGLLAGTQYFYRVRAINTEGNSAYTAEVSATTTAVGAPLAPGGPGAFAVSSSAINLVWTDNSTNETGFQIERSLTAGSGFTLISTAPPNFNSYSNTNLASGTRYYYRIRAISGNVTSAYTAEVNATTSGSVIPAPSVLTVVAVSTSAIDLSWTDNSTNETGFQIERSTTSGAGFTLIATTTVNVVSFSNTGLTNGTQYFYRVRAVNGSGSSVYTSEVGAITNFISPNPPLGFVATVTSALSVDLTWVDNSNNETGFQIERSLTSGTGYSLVMTTTANTTSYADASLSPGTTYYYRIRATNPAGNSAYTSELSASTSTENYIPDAVEFNALKIIAATSDGDRLVGLGWPSASNWPQTATSQEFGNWNGVTVENGDITEISFLERDFYGVFPNVLQPLTKLKKLLLDNTLLYGIRTTQNLPGIEELRIGHNSIMSDILNFNHFTGLKTLGLNDFNLNISGLNISPLQELEWIEIQRSNCSSLPIGMAGLTKLQQVYMQDNSIVTLPNEVLNWSQLQRLYLPNNNLRDLPIGMTGLLVLTNLDVSGNILDFGDLEQFFNGENSLKKSDFYLGYQDQRNYGPQNIIAVSGKYSIKNDRGDGAHSRFQWQQFIAGGWSDLQGKTSKDLEFTSMDQTYINSRYRCEITNDWITDLTLYSSEFTVQSVSGYPVATPGILTATASSASSTILSWIDNVIDETGFEIERSLTASTGYSLVGTTTVNAVSYVDAGLTTGTQYYYRIRAINANGSSAYTSVASVLLSATPPVNQGMVWDAIEYAALKDIYDSLGGGAWTTKTNWPTPGNWPTTATVSQFGTWYGVTVINGDITKIDLKNNNLTGSIPTSIGKIAFLQWIDLTNNSSIGGTIPKSLFKMPKLQNMRIYNTNISGVIPQEISLPNIKEILVYNNKISGTIPLAITTLKTLNVLAFYGQPDLGGEIPMNIGDLTELNYLRLNGNNLTGSIPSSMGKLTKLTLLYLSTNKLEGEIPHTLKSLTKIQYFLMAENRLTGTIPSFFGKMPDIFTLSLEGNQFSGSLPDSLKYASKLNYLVVSNNKLEGAIPSWIDGLPLLRTLNLSMNNFIGAIPNQFQNLTRLNDLNLSYTNLEGVIPAWLVNISTLKTLTLNNCRFISFPQFADRTDKNQLKIAIENNSIPAVDIEQNFTGPAMHPFSTFTYAPQQSVQSDVVLNIPLHNELRITAQPGGTHNIYLWEKLSAGTWTNISNLNESTEPTIFLISAAATETAGTYRYTVTNSWLPGITSVSGSITVEILDEINTTPVKGLYNGLIASTRWRTDKAYLAEGTEFSGMYMYTYDDNYQIQDARWAEVDHTLSTYQFANNKYRLTGMDYDPNGNILKLKRYDEIGARTHNFNYSYEVNKNKLTSVTGYTNVYTYNAIGQMIGEDKVEEGKDQYVEYDVTGKVTAVYADLNKTQKKVEYLYDDRGFRLAKVSHPPSTGEGAAGKVKTTWYIRDASGNVLTIYEQEGVPAHDDVANTNALSKKEIPIYGSGKLGTYYPNQDDFVNFEITDHLGNVRALVREESFAETATMEPAREEYERGKFLRYDNVRKIYSYIFDHTTTYTPPPPGGNPTPGNPTADPRTDEGYSIRLTGTANEKRGLAKSFAIVPGDRIHMEVYAKYLDGNSTWSGALNTLIANIVAGTAGGGIVVDGNKYASNSTTPLPYAGYLNTDNSTGTGPRAYLNWILFDKDFDPIDGGFKRMSDVAKENGSDVPHEKLEHDLTVTQPGYIYIYFSNDSETPVEVYFDDFTVTHTGSYVSQATDYGVWGDVLREQKSELDLNYKYKFGYQGQFAEKDEETGWNHFELREYDAIIGRWTSVDPKRVGFSPYIGMGNNPVSGTDPDGGSPTDIIEMYNGQEVSRIVNDDPFDIVIQTWDNKITGSFTTVGVYDKIWFSGFQLSPSEWMRQYREYNPLATGEAGRPWIDPIDLAGSLLAGGVKVFFGAGARVAGSKFVATGTNSVYMGVVDDVPYVGITKNLAARTAFWKSALGMEVDALPGLKATLSRMDARAVEQVLLERMRNMGPVLNKINSISPKNPIYPQAIQRGNEILKQLGH